MSATACPDTGRPPGRAHLTIIDAACAGAAAPAEDLPSEPDVMAALTALAAARGATLDWSSRTALFRAYRMGAGAERPWSR